MTRKEAIATVYGKEAVEDYDKYTYWVPSDVTYIDDVKWEGGEWFVSVSATWQKCEELPQCAYAVHRWPKPKPRTRMISIARDPCKFAIAAHTVRRLQGALAVGFYDKTLLDAILSDYIKVTKLEEPE